LFLGYNYLLWEIAHRWGGVAPEHAYLVLRYAVIAQTGPALIGVYALGKELTASRRAATASALLVAASPYFVIYSGRGMSEIPGYLMLGWSLWWMLRSLRRGSRAGFLLAALLVGVSANIREFAVFYLPFIPIAARLHGLRWRTGGVAMAMAALGALAGMMFWVCYDTDNYIRAVTEWYGLSAAERKLNPVTAANLRFFAQYTFHCSAAVAMLTPLALVWSWMRRGSANRPVCAASSIEALVEAARPPQTEGAGSTQTPENETARTGPFALPVLFWFACFGLLADLALIANHDLAVNPRYMLTGLIGLAPACGWCLSELIRRMRGRALPLLLGLLMLTKGSYNHMARELYGQQWSARAARDYFAKVERLPWNSGFIVGARTPLIHFFAGVGARPYWRTISPGADWPDGDRLDQAIQDFFSAGRLVYVDFDPELWQTGARKTSREADDLERLQRTYRLELLRDSFYRVVERLPHQTSTDAARVRTGQSAATDSTTACRGCFCGNLNNIASNPDTNTQTARNHMPGL
jgi:hypothetical protein